MTSTESLAAPRHTIGAAIKWQRLDWEGACAVCGVTASWEAGPIVVTYPGWLAVCEGCTATHAPELLTLLELGRRHAPTVELLTLLGKLGPVEVQILGLVARRLAIGQERYGRFNLATDGRDFSTEAIEEVADALVYAACGLLKR